MRRLDLAHTVHMARQNWQDSVNGELCREGLAVRLDLRSFQAQGRTEIPLRRVPIIEFVRGRRGKPDTPFYDYNQAQLEHRAIAAKNPRRRSFSLTRAITSQPPKGAQTFCRWWQQAPGRGTSVGHHQSSSRTGTMWRRPTAASKRRVWLPTPCSKKRTRIPKSGR